MTSAATRIASPGVALRGVGDSEITIRFSLRALLHVEQDFGTIAEGVKALNEARDAIVADCSGKCVETLDRLAHAATGDPDVLDHLDERLDTLLTAIIVAWSRAFPDPDNDAASPDTSGKAERSHGSGSIGGGPSSSDEPTASSGD